MSRVRALIGAACLALGAGLVAAEAPPTGHPNVLFVMIDTVRADHVHCYGYPRPTTPHLDDLASQGTRCGLMISAASWTLPSLMSMFTSLPPSLHGVVQPDRSLHRAEPTLAECLAKSGYQTVGFVSNPLAGAKFGFGRGFELYDDYTVDLSNEMALPVADGRPESHSGVTSPIVNRLALDWLAHGRDARRPFFLFLLYVDAHADYEPPPPFDRAFVDPAYSGTEDGRHLYERTGGGAAFDPGSRQRIIDLYDGEIRGVDERIGEVLAALDQQGLAKDTLVVAVADHGEELWDHGGMFHGHSLFDELLRVPCILRWPGHIPPASVIERQTTTLDLMPTILRTVGIEAPPHCAGHPFVGAGSDDHGPDAMAVSETQVVHRLVSARSRTGKIVWDRTDDRWYAFQFSDDRQEQHALAQPLPEWAQRMQDQLKGWVTLADQAAAAGPDAHADAPLDPSLVHQLRSMGYLH